MPMQQPREFFVHGLSDIYDAEQRILQVLPLMTKECTDPQISSALQKHEQETRQQVQNLEQCFQSLGVQPDRASCFAIAGLKQEHDAFLKEQPSPDLLTAFDLDATSKTEHYEIASYRSLIEQAQAMGESRCATLLQQNLQQEEAMAKWFTNTMHQRCQQMSAHMRSSNVSGQQRPQAQP